MHLYVQLREATVEINPYSLISGFHLPVFLGSTCSFCPSGQGRCFARPQLTTTVEDEKAQPPPAFCSPVRLPLPSRCGPAFLGLPVQGRDGLTDGQSSATPDLAVRKVRSSSSQMERESRVYGEGMSWVWLKWRGTGTLGPHLTGERSVAVPQ